MKKLLLSFLLLSFAFIAQAQEAKPTKEETLSYIKAKFSTPGIEQINQEGFVSVSTIYYDKTILKILVLRYSNITDVQYKKWKDKEWRIDIVGAGHYTAIDHYEYKKDLNTDKSEIIYEGKTFGKQFDDSFRIPFDLSLPETEIKKYVKALKHMATLHNAKLIKDDLFGN